jgi:hypothetical protein
LPAPRNSRWENLRLKRGPKAGSWAGQYKSSLRVVIDGRKMPLSMRRDYIPYRADYSRRGVTASEPATPEPRCCIASRHAWEKPARAGV